MRHNLTKSHGSRIPFIRFGLSALLLTLAGCVTPAPATIDDPLAEIGRGSVVISEQYKHVALGIIFTENTRRAIDVVQRTRATVQSLSFLGGAEGAADLDPV